MAHYVAKTSSQQVSLIVLWFNWRIRSALRSVSVYVETFGTAKIDENRISELVREHFPLKPRGIIEHLQLLRPIFRKTAAYGHFGREEPEFIWEKTDKADALKEAAGL